MHFNILFSSHLSGPCRCKCLFPLSFILLKKIKNVTFIGGRMSKLEMFYFFKKCKLTLINRKEYFFFQNKGNLVLVLLDILKFDKWHLRHMTCCMMDFFIVKVKCYNNSFLLLS